MEAQTLDYVNVITDYVHLTWSFYVHYHKINAMESDTPLLNQCFIS